MKANRKNHIILFTVIVSLMMSAVSSHAAGLLKPVGVADSAVSIKSHHVTVTINNGYARTEVDQVFENTTDRDLDAVYSFPLPKQASLSELSLWIDGNEVIGEVLEKKKAREIHEEQKSQGKDTALAEKDDFKTFDVSVSPVRAHNETRVRLVYYQPLEIDLGIGCYLYPMAEGGVDEERIAFWEVDNKVSGSFTFDLTLKSAFPVKDVRVPHYKAAAAIKKVNSITDGETEGTAGGDVYTVSIASAEGATLSDDIVFYYRLDESVPARVELIPYKPDAASPGTFMAVITPGASLKRIAEGTDWTFVLDVSGSMQGGKINTLCKGVCKVIGKLAPNDRFRVITFNNNARDITGGYVNATPENVKKYLEVVDNIQANGSTALFAGLKEAYNALDDDRTTGIILVTDGVCNVGPTQHTDFLNLINQKDIRLFTFVIGNSANQPLMDRLAKDSGGFAMNISDRDDIVGRLIQAKAKVLHEKLHDVKLRIHGAGVSDMTPKDSSSLYLGQQLIVFGHYDKEDDVKLTLSAKISGEEKSWSCKAHFPAQDTDNPELERLWALSRIDEIMQEIREKGESSAKRKQVVNLGTEYSLVTDYTSMLVIEEAEMENKGFMRRNAQRVHRERQARQNRAQRPVRNYQVSRNSGSRMFKSPAPSIGGSGPVGFLLIGLAAWLRKRKNVAGKDC
jgi:Ca-activated chloride channel family protein